MADTDSDGALDGMEVYQGSDPKDAGSQPAINLLINGSTAVPPVSVHGTDLSGNQAGGYKRGSHL